MTLVIDATSIDFADALEGEIRQVIFDTVPEDQDEDQRSTPYILISRNFECPGSATIEWHDGHDYDGGAEILSVTLKRTRITLCVNRELNFEVTFHLPDKKFKKLTSFLRKMMDDRISIAD